ncbi:hypothetical protein [Burkholderia cepacia]|uniref:hypothetical protein n=1 Tax=Burkholderia cepacia TaxID=292 RepID=UPI00158A92DD|nr:hypothetical protein [Burkholderia cepacia]
MLLYNENNDIMHNLAGQFAFKVDVKGTKRNFDNEFDILDFNNVCYVFEQIGDEAHDEYHKYWIYLSDDVSYELRYDYDTEIWILVKNTEEETVFLEEEDFNYFDSMYEKLTFKIKLDSGLTEKQTTKKNKI